MAVTLPAVAGAASPADLAEAVVVDVTSLTDAGMVTVGVADLTDAGMAFPADPAGVVTVGVTDLAIAGVAPLADAGIVFPADPAEMVTIGVTINLTDVTPVNVIGVPECGYLLLVGVIVVIVVVARSLVSREDVIRKNSDAQFGNSM